LNDDFIFQNYLIVFLDHLGQRDRLRKIKNLPTNEKEREEFLELIRNSVGRVLNTRNYFKNFFEAYLITTSNYSPKFTSQDFNEILAASSKCNLHFYGLSDSIIIAVPLMNDDENCTAINSIHAALVATCSIGLVSLSLKNPIRAGIDIGIATQIDDKEIYGPALERAYHLESNLAEYPRLLVGNELMNYLDWVANQTTNTTTGLVAKEMVPLCRDLIISDTDGRLMLDFLGSKIKEMSGGNINNNIAIDAYNYVKSQFNEYREQENDKMSSRYYRLLRYFLSRKNLWKIE